MMTKEREALIKELEYAKAEAERFKDAGTGIDDNYICWDDNSDDDDCQRVQNHSGDNGQ